MFLRGNNYEKYEYFNHLYTEKDDLSRLPKKWNKIKGSGRVCVSVWVEGILELFIFHSTSL